MRTTKNMDYIYDDNGQPILIDLLQKDTREKVIAYFVQCRKEKKMTQADIARRTGIPRNPFFCYNDSMDAYTISACPGGPATGSAFGQERRLKPHETEKNSFLYDGAAAGSHHAPDGFCGNL